MKQTVKFFLILVGVALNAGAQDFRFYEPSWAGASGQDGKGGVSLVSQGDKVKILVRKDPCPLPVPSAVLNETPQWIAWQDQGSGEALAFDFTWVTTAENKFWGKRWAGGGIAFNPSWSPMDLSAAKYLVLHARVNSPQAGKVDFGLALIGDNDSATGEVRLSDFLPNKRLGLTWARAVIPLSAFPNLSSFDRSRTRQIRLNLLGEYPENQLVSVRFNNIYFTSEDLVTSVDNVGWLELPDGILLVWDQEPSASLKKFLIRLDKKVIARQAPNRNMAKIPASYFPKGKHTLGVAAASEKETSDFREISVTFGKVTYASASVSLTGELKHEISPYIYGLNYADAELLKATGATLDRMGGNATTTYNWKDDADNRGADWYFLNVAYSPPGAKEEEKYYFKRARAALDSGAQFILTIPTIGWVAKRPPEGGRLSSYPLSLFPNQEADDSGAGNGRYKDGSFVWGNDPSYNYVPSTPDFQREWVRTCVKLFGPASQGGILFYSLDNEPGLWHWNHRDIRPEGIGYDDLVELNAQYAKMVKEEDPSAKVIGFVAWGVKELAGSAWDYMPGGKKGYKEGEKGITSDGQKWTDRRAHGDVPQFIYYLREMKKRSSAAGVQLIDYVDNHGFPEVWRKNEKGELVNVLGDFPYSDHLTPLQFDALRVFYDPTFVNEESWCYAHGNAPYLFTPWVPLIPKLKKYIAENFPGVKLAMTEYYPASKSYYHGALLKALQLGIFMQEGMDLACDWGGTEPGNYVFYGHKLFSNYDDRGSKVLGRFAPSVVSSKDLYAFAARQNAVTRVVVVNKNKTEGFHVKLHHPWPAENYTLYVIAETLGKRVLRLGTAKTDGSPTVRVPPFSAVLAVLQ